MKRETLCRRLAGPAFALATIALLLLVPTLPAAVPGKDSPREQLCATSGKRFHRTELYLGMSTPDGATVSDAEFQRFVDSQVSPRLPEGFTIVAASGQFQDFRGGIVREQTRVLVVLYPLGDAASSERIEAIRASYRAAYRQESVLRVDDESCASF